MILSGRANFRRQEASEYRAETGSAGPKAAVDDITLVIQVHCKTWHSQPTAPMTNGEMVAKKAKKLCRQLQSKFPGRIYTVVPVRSAQPKVVGVQLGFIRKWCIGSLQVHGKRDMTVSTSTACHAGLRDADAINPDVIARPTLRCRLPWASPLIGVWSGSTGPSRGSAGRRATRRAWLSALSAVWSGRSPTTWLKRPLT